MTLPRCLKDGERGRLLRDARVCGSGANGTPVVNIPAGTVFTLIDGWHERLDWFAALIDVDGERHLIGQGFINLDADPPCVQREDT